MALKKINSVILSLVLGVGLVFTLSVWVWLKHRGEANQAVLIRSTPSPIVSKFPVFPAENYEKNRSSDSKVQLQFKFYLKNKGKSEVKRELSSTPAESSEDEHFLINEGTNQAADPNKKNCHPLEYQGDGFDLLDPLVREEGRLVALFHESKRLLGEWIKKVEWSEMVLGNFGEGSSESATERAKRKDLVIKRLLEIQMELPPSSEEPDLVWRGIGVWTRDQKEHPLLRFGSGFIRLALHQPQRALFEMTRLVAQSWAPCELQRIGSRVKQHQEQVKAPWQDLLNCLEVSEPSRACGDGIYSDAGWAVSSSIAYVVAPPGCELPFFALPKKRECLEKLKSSLEKM